MDPLIGAVVAAVLWFFLRGIIGAVIVFLSVFLGGFLAEVFGQPFVAGVVIFIGWLGAIAWWIFAIIQTVLEVVRIVQLASGVPA